MIILHGYNLPTKPRLLPYKKQENFVPAVPIDLPLLYCELLILPFQGMDYFNSSRANSEIMNLSQSLQRLTKTMLPAALGSGG
jgi:hypothetical protein